jgi:hypothetical protein
MAGWQAARLGEIPPVDDGDPADWRPLRHHFGIRAFGVNSWTASEPGQEVVEKHDELQPDGAAGHEELYMVTAGRATFTVDGSPLDAPAGTLVFVSDPALVRSAVAEEPGTTVLCIGGWPDRAFEPSDWEQKWVAS